MFERFAARCWRVIFVIGGIVILTKAAHLGAPARPFPGGFWVAAGRHLRLRGRLEPLRLRLHPLPAARRRPHGRACSPGSGVFVSCVLLETFGAAAVTALGGDFGGNPTPTAYTGLLPGWLGKLTLLGIAWARSRRTR